MKKILLVVATIFATMMTAQNVPSALERFPFTLESDIVSSPTRQGFEWDVTYARIENSRYTLDILNEVSLTADFGLEPAVKIGNDHIYRYSYKEEGVEGMIFVDERNLHIEVSVREHGIIDTGR